MKASFVLICSLLAAILALPNCPSAATQAEIMIHAGDYPEMQEYSRIFFDNLNDQNLDWPEKCRKIIGEYEAFIRKYPKSEFADEAKLRIAEFYELSGNVAAARPYLDDIIANYADADYFSLGKPSEAGTKTAAWALYYRGVWFGGPQAVTDWKTILEKYPQSREAVGLARLELKKRGAL